jgi:thymidylate synthase (FAD)
MSEEPETPEPQQTPEHLVRPGVPALDEILGKPFRILDDGFIRVVDYMGSDQSIVQAARVSYGEGTKQVSQDRGLIRYLMRHHHTTPFEMCEIKLHVRVPMDCWRQWVRHRTACLAEGTEVYFDLPGGIQRRGNQLYKLKIEEIWKRFQPTQNRSRPDKQRNPFFSRDRIRTMRLRQINEETMTIQHTRIADVFHNGRKPVFRVLLADGKKIEATTDHRFFFSNGWQTLHEATGLHEEGGKAVWNQGDYFLYINGATLERPALYQDRTWLNEQYNVRAQKIDDIAAGCGVSYHTIRKWLRLFGIQHEKGGRSKAPWNAHKMYRLGTRRLSDAWREANRRSRSGAASNFWREGVSKERAFIGRWTTQIAHKIHERNGWTCQLCHQRAGELHCHHIIPVWADPSLARDERNLTTLCGDCHRSIQGRELEFIVRLGGPPVKSEWKKQPRVAWNKLIVAKLVRIERFEFVGLKETYDLEVEGPFHNFIAEGIVTHNSINEYSTRYSIAIDAAQTTDPSAWRLQSAGNRQGSEGVLAPETGAAFSEKERELQKLARHYYEERLEAGIAREQARKDLPLSTYTEAYWKTNLHNLFHFLHLRMDDHAQWEIRQYALTIGHEIVSRWCPIAWQAFLDYRVQAMHLTRLDWEIIRAIQGGDTKKAIELAVKFRFLSEDGTPRRNRERNELEAKLRQLHIPIPWDTGARH